MTCDGVVRDAKSALVVRLMQAHVHPCTVLLVPRLVGIPGAFFQEGVSQPSGDLEPTQGGAACPNDLSTRSRRPASSRLISQFNHQHTPGCMGRATCWPMRMSPAGCNTRRLLIFSEFAPTSPHGTPRAGFRPPGHERRDEPAYPHPTSRTDPTSTPPNRLRLAPSGPREIGEACKK